MKQPWLKFYPSDWRSDAALRMCSMAARGLWMEMLGLMHHAEPYGHLVVNGSALDPKQLSQLAGCGLRECVNLLAELESCGVFSRTSEGIIYSRKMKRDFERSLKDKENGARGGNPILKGGVNPEDKAQKLEARSQSLDKKEDASLRSATPVKKYAFESGIIKLNDKTLSSWSDAFSYLDLKAELIALSEWAEEQPNWFHAVKGALGKRNREQKTKIEQSRILPFVRHGPGDPNAGII